MGGPAVLGCTEAMAVTREQVVHIARLARLRLSEAEIEQMTRDLGVILAHMKDLEALDTTGVERTTALGAPATPLRPDEPASGLDAETALGEAPRRGEAAFVVPGFVES